MAEWRNCEEDYLQVKCRQDWGTTCVCPTCGGLSRTDTGIKHRKQTAAETLSTSVHKHTGSFCSSKHWAERMQKHKRNILLLLTFSRAADLSLLHSGGEVCRPHTIMTQAYSGLQKDKRWTHADLTLIPPPQLTNDGDQWMAEEQEEAACPC